MKKTLILTACCLITCTATFSEIKAQTNESHSSYIEVNGYAEQEIAPDIFYMNIEINEQDSKGKKSLEDQQRSMTASLKALGIDTDKQLTRLSLDSQYYNKRTNLAKAVYQLKLTKSEDVAKVWKKMDALGISNVAFTKAEYSKIKELQKEVQMEAARNAREQADAMAEAIGQKAGKCFYIYGSRNSAPVIYGQARMTKSVMLNSYDTAAEEAIETVEFNNIKVSASVSTKFDLE